MNLKLGTAGGYHDFTSYSLAKETCKEAAYKSYQYIPGVHSLIMFFTFEIPTFKVIIRSTHSLKRCKHSNSTASDDGPSNMGEIKLDRV